MIKIGEVKREREWERVSFKEWVREGYARAGSYGVRVIFPPARYPTFTVIFEDLGNRMEVRIHIQTEKMKAVFNALGLPLKKSDLPALLFEVEGGEEEGWVYGLNLDPEPDFYLEWRGTFWVRKKKEEEVPDLEL